MRILRALVLTSTLFLAACLGPEPPCSDLDEAACLDDELCVAEYLESCGCSCADEGCGDGCCEYGACLPAD